MLLDDEVVDDELLNVGILKSREILLILLYEIDEAEQWIMLDEIDEHLVLFDYADYDEVAEDDDEPI